MRNKPRLLLFLVILAAAIAERAPDASTDRPWRPGSVRAHATVFQSFGDEPRRKDLRLLVSVQLYGRPDSCVLRVRGRGLRFSGRSEWSKVYRSLRDGIVQPITGTVVWTMDTCVVSLDVAFHDRALDHYEWRCRLDATPPGERAVTSEMMVANTLRDGKSWHYAGLDLAEGPSPWGVTSERIEAASLGLADTVVLDGTSAEWAGAIGGFPVFVLVGADGRVLDARCWEFHQGIRVARKLEQQLMKRSLRVTSLDGHPISLWRGVWVHVRRPDEIFEEPPAVAIPVPVPSPPSARSRHSRP